MKKNPGVNKVKRLVESKGYQVDSISYIPRGIGHYNFDIVLNSGESLIARFENDSRLTVHRRVCDDGSCRKQASQGYQG